MSSTPVLNPPRNHQWVKTEDGSWTIFSEYFQESAHSTHGAISETKLRFIEGCQLKNQFDKGDTRNYKIFEVGFGLGIGALETFDLWFKKQCSIPVEFISCEIDEELILWCKKNLESILQETYSKEVWILFDQLELDPTGRFYQSHFNHKFFLKIFRGDILTHQQYITDKYKNSIDSIFQDAYSPKKNPTLWTHDWFVFLKSLTKKQTILSTYSSSTSVRQNLQSAGFHILNGPGFGKKKSSTLAYATAIEDLEFLPGNIHEKK